MNSDDTRDVDGDVGVDDERLLAALRGVWEQYDPPPAGLTDRMIAAVAVDDVSRDLALLELQTDAERAAVRSDRERLTLQFSDETTSVLLHVSVTESGLRRVDGWSDPAVLAARLAQDEDEKEWTAELGEQGRFAFDGISPGLARVRLSVQHPDGPRGFVTPQFQV
ncbi:hypothetical protein [Georgenia deserti]|uniref:Uncharacterized protein n=1 Tax=Georgenia deserti TaxID=2093781 RepID=A0ABW4LA75_9MICO